MHGHPHAIQGRTAPTGLSVRTSPTGTDAAPPPAARGVRTSLRHQLAKPMALAAFGLFYGLLFATVVILPLAVVLFGLVILFG